MRHLAGVRVRNLLLYPAPTSTPTPTAVQCEAALMNKPVGLQSPLGSEMLSQPIRGPEMWGDKPFPSGAARPSPDQNLLPTHQTPVGKGLGARLYQVPCP